MLYGTITEFCTEDSCPIMSAGPKYEYHWADGHTVKKPIKCSAPKYIDYLMTWVQDQLDDETLFPSKIGKLIAKNMNQISPHLIVLQFLNIMHVPLYFTKLLDSIFRSSFSKKFPVYRKDDLKEIVQSLRPYLPPALRRGGATWRGSTFEYVFQTFYIFRSGQLVKIIPLHLFTCDVFSGIQLDREKGIGPSTGIN